MSVVVVLVLLLFNFLVDGGRVPVHLFFVVCYYFLDQVVSCLVSFPLRQLLASCSSGRASVPV